MMPEDWRLLFEEWESLPLEHRKRIEALLREKPKERLAALFEREPYALRLYEKVVGKWVRPPPTMGLGPAEKTRLEDAYKRVFIEAGADWRRTIPALRDELASLQEELKFSPREKALEAARMRIEDLARRLLPPPRPLPEVAPPRIPALITLPEPRVTTYICPIDGVPFVSADPDTMYYVKTALRWFPKEYFEYCPEDQKELMGWPPLEGIIQEGFEAGILPPMWARWLMRVAEAIKTAKGLPI